MTILRLVICFGVLLQIGPLFSVAKSAEFDKVYHGNVSKGQDMEYTYTHNTSEKNAVRVHINSTEAHPDFPILLVIKRPRSVLSWTVPYVASNNVEYSYVSHTLCPDRFITNTSYNEPITVVVSTSSTLHLNFSLSVSFVEGYHLKTNQSQVVRSDPATPQYYQYEFPEGVDMVIVKANSEDSICSYFSIQTADCPIYDDVATVRYKKGAFQTITKKGAITVTRDMVNDVVFMVVVVVHANDNQCEEDGSIIPDKAQATYSSNDTSPRMKNVTITVQNTLETDEYWKPILTTFGVILAIYLLTGLILGGYVLKQKKYGKYVPGNEEERARLIDNEVIQEREAPLAPQGQASMSNYGTAGPGPGSPMENVVRNGNSPTTERIGSPARRRVDPTDDGVISIDENEIDMLEDIESTKEVYRTKPDLFVSDLARKKYGSLEKKYNMYAWNLFTVSVFYALPVVQLVITYQVVTNLTGNQDSCFYNFQCAKPYGWFSAFNNVFSNTGYVMLGILFLLLVWRRDYLSRTRVLSGDEKEKTHGIPKHYGLLYALGYALIMEGIMSGCYHVCPNRANYQFDTAYMYMIACLGMLKMYQQRHPDINANSYISFAVFALILFIGFLGLRELKNDINNKKSYKFSFAVFALILFIGVLGLLFASLYFYIAFFFVHMLTCLGLSAQIYYMGTVHLDWGIFKRTLVVCKADIFTCAKPTHPARVALLLLGNFVNLALSIFGLVTAPLDFASFLLAIMIVNMLLYLSFYFVMKLICKERILLVVILFITLMMFVWAGALYFFQLGETAWQYSAAMSRERNDDCYIMGFFDGHDIWHFLSAFALFVSFVSVLLVDDDLEDTPRTKIRVF